MELTEVQVHQELRVQAEAVVHLLPTEQQVAEVQAEQAEVVELAEAVVHRQPTEQQGVVVHQEHLLPTEQQVVVDRAEQAEVVGQVE